VEYHQFLEKYSRAHPDSVPLREHACEPAQRSASTGIKAEPYHPLRSASACAGFTLTLRSVSLAENLRLCPNEPTPLYQKEISMPKKVFLCTDTFIQRRSYYIVAEDERRAEEDARNTPFPDYLDHDDDSHLEHEDCTVDTCVETIFLVKISTLSSDTERSIIRLIPTKREDANVYQGYLVEDDTVDVTRERTYASAEWQLLNEE
jgi:hypothetical protein